MTRRNLLLTALFINRKDDLVNFLGQYSDGTIWSQGVYSRIALIKVYKNNKPVLAALKRKAVFVTFVIYKPGEQRITPGVTFK